MIKNRALKISRGKLWQVYFDNTPDDILFEGSKTSCLDYLRRNSKMAQYKQGTIRIGQVIWE